MSEFKVIPWAPRAYRGKRARRQAFYERRRTARALDRIINSHPWAERARSDIDGALLDAIIYGMGAVEIVTQWDYGNGLTDRPPQPGEWPRSMLRTRRLDATDFGA